MEGEFNNFMMVWFSVLVSLSYCYGVAKLVPVGIPRLFFIFPIVILFFLLPLKLSTIHLGGGTAFFITWLGSFKLLLFSFGKGPLALDPSMSLGKFLAIACLPIEIRQNPSPNLHPNGENREIPPSKPLKRPEKIQLGIKNPSLPNPNQNGKIKENPPQKSGSKSPLLVYAMKGLLLAVLVHALGYKEHFHQKVILALNCLLIYILLEILLSTVAFTVRVLLGLEIEPHFNDPLLSTSLQDFWGKRWNLMVSRVLRPTVYEPIISFSELFIGREWAPLPAVMGTFLVSGLMHELIFYYMGRVRPTWEVTWFFFLHGLCLAVEIVLKKKLVLVFPGRWRLPWMIPTVLTLGFLMETCYWLFFPQFLRCNADVRIIQEYADFGAFLKSISQKFASLVR
ncbi:acyl-CoA--sterol O-acyltransferase 1-like [Ziziphus jujuba]|uniref:Acyl-CoA--sterol O-acyltransferase 1-like n=1 Tax=Ziziphus jujuba TaxID=326968 RepID=A0ABM4A0H3_ZIZJJ|nr:acyl-CoA--sterol O-acyltransferase 1-like [Ziziphus jujuba]